MARKRSIRLDDVFFDLVREYNHLVLLQHTRREMGFSVYSHQEEVLSRIGKWALESSGEDQLEKECIEIQEVVSNREKQIRAAREAEKVSKPYKFRKTIPARLREKIFKRDGYRCVKCGSQENLTVDHILPVRHYGPDDESNLQTLCKSCNSRKGSKIPQEINAPNEGPIQ